MLIISILIYTCMVGIGAKFDMQICITYSLLKRTLSSL